MTSPFAFSCRNPQSKFGQIPELEIMGMYCIPSLFFYYLIFLTLCEDNGYMNTKDNKKGGNKAKTSFHS